jgi:PIN domain nuclease of toxin-antitoxin system
MASTTSDESRALVLDTHIWIWYVQNESKQFSRRIVQPVEDAVQRGDVVVSAISVWEVAMLEALGRIDLSLDIRAWVGRALSFPGVRLKGLSPTIAVESTRLPGNPHRDPADRLLIATARFMGAALVTRDERILSYARQGHVRVVDATP